jgi:RNA polymerase sigma-70 factor (ECF subfamily)
VTPSTISGVAAARIEELLPAARDGSADACGRLWNLVRKYLLTVANRELPDTLRAKIGGSDLVQETLIDAQRNLARFEGRTHADLLTWLRRILLNHISNANRRYVGRGVRGRGRELPLDGGSSIVGPRLPPMAERDSPSRVAVAREEADRIEQILREFPDDYRRVIRLRSWDRCTFVEIGERLDCSADAARKLWLRAIERFERRWAQSPKEL